MLDVTAGVRDNFYVVVSKEAEKLSEAVHVALNRVLFNYSRNAEAS